uniref:Zgc:195245 n=1 Tax=Seriola lalandi dorsalis TaxID=1841481 RepID=A0A3B4WKU1_SERLL
MWLDHECNKYRYLYIFLPNYFYIRRPTFLFDQRHCRAKPDRLTDSDDNVQPRKLNGSSVDTPSYQNLHRELLLSHKRGLLLEEKPELKRVLEQRRLELHKEEEMARRGPSDLETELRKRQQKLQEQEEIRRRENQQKIPEFVRVKDNLRRTQAFEQ